MELGASSIEYKSADHAGLIYYRLVKHKSGRSTVPHDSRNKGEVFRSIITITESNGQSTMKCMRGLGRKRDGISEGLEEEAAAWRADSADFRAPLKRQCNARLLLDDLDKSGLESLPQDILIWILCRIEHDNLKQLVHVSKTIKDATVVAKQWHFAFKTPTKIRAFRNSIDLQNPSDYEEIEAPNAPLRSFKSRISRKNLADVTTVLF